MTDRYTRVVLTVIAGALVYLCIVMTAFPAVHAQAQGTKYPGEFAGPAQVTIVGWKMDDPLPVQFQRPVPVMVNNELLRITGTVQTERSSRVADRVVLVGWEQNSTVEKPAQKSFTRLPFAAGLPVSQQ